MERDGVMRNLSFSVLGAVGGSSETHGTLADLLASVPYLLSARLIPPLRIVNDLLRKGVHDAGMSGGCTWEPFEVTQSEWDDVARHLKGLSSRKRCRFVQPPEWVETLEDWSTWIMIFKHGYPEEFRGLAQDSAALDKAHKEAMKAGNADLAATLYVRLVEADARLSDFVMTHRRTKAK